MNSSDGSCARAPAAPPRPEGAAPSRRTVALRSVGCRTNQQELVALAGQLADAGFSVVRDSVRAGIVIVNTCCVTAAAEGKTRRLVARIARENPGARILVTGCGAQLNPGSCARTPSVQWVVANSDKHRIAALLDQPPGVFHGPPLAPPSAGVLLPRTVSAAVGRTRLPVKIQEGCDFRCAYCIVPLVRGASRSVPSAEVVDLCRRAADMGVREIVLTGTHIGQYRDTAVGLEGLCERLSGLAGDFRVRLSSLDPRDLTDGILALLGGHPRFCPHLHVSVQSLSPDVLRMMGRGGGDTERLAERLAAFRGRCPDAALGGDFIVGFPGETDAMFESTVARVRTAGFTYGHVFSFSPRPGTPAALMRPRVHPRLVRQRHALLSSELAQRTSRFLESMAGTRQRIVVEQTGPVRGLTGNYIRVRATDCRAQLGEWLEVEITGRVGRGREQCTAVALGGQ